MAVRRLGTAAVVKPRRDGRADAAVVHCEARARGPEAAKSDNAHQEGESNHRAALWAAYAPAIQQKLSC